MIKINKSDEPVCLTALKAEHPDAKYADLKDECLKTVRNQLAAEQRKLCAYCQRAFKSQVFIEHFSPQTTSPEKQLDYENFLGVCSGKYYIDKKTGKHIPFCSYHRASFSLVINPENQAHIDTILYDKDHKIVSKNSLFQLELNDILNLNFEELCEERKDNFEEELDIVQKEIITPTISPLNVYEKAIRSIQKRNPPYSGYLLYRFKKLADFYKNKPIN